MLHLVPSEKRLSNHLSHPRHHTRSVAIFSVTYRAAVARQSRKSNCLRAAAAVVDFQRLQQNPAEGVELRHHLALAVVVEPGLAPAAAPAAARSIGSTQRSWHSHRRLHKDLRLAG